jgi:hypothetical protein
MRTPKSITPDAAKGKAGRKPNAFVLESERNTVPPDTIRPFIPPPTRKQLMAGSASVRRVYKFEP